MEEISKFLCPSNVFDIYQSAEDLDMPRLKNNCLKYMAENLEEVCTLYSDSARYHSQDICPSNSQELYKN